MVPDEDADVTKQQPLARARPGGRYRARRSGRLDRRGEDADVIAAEVVEMWTRTRACGDACDDAEDAAAGESEATLTRTRLGADAGRQMRTDEEASGCR